MSDVTLVLGIDAKTIQQLAWSIKTWRLFHDELWEMPWCVFYDSDQVQPPVLREVVRDDRGLFPRGGIKFVEWPQIETVRHPETQRARMLRGFVYVPALYVDTSWWMKLDTDAIALGGSHRLWEPEWLETRPVPAMIASPWGYTKAKGDDRSGAQWAEALEVFGDQWCDGPRLDLATKVDGARIGYPRIASWMSFYGTRWTRTAAAAFNAWSESRDLKHQLPVPSQDTCHWYYAERNGAYYKRVKFKKRGWTNVPRFDSLKARVQELVAT